jgi:hypothetical protein
MDNTTTEFLSQAWKQWEDSSMRYWVAPNTTEGEDREGNGGKKQTTKESTQGKKEQEKNRI